MFSGGAVRYRFYAGQNISLATMGKVMVFISLMLWTGIFAVGSIALIAEPQVVAAALHFPPAVLRAAGLLLLSLVAGYVLFSLAVRRPLCLWKWEVRLPSFGTSLGQVLISSADWLLAALALYVLLPPPAVPFLVFPRSPAAPTVLAALLAFRVIYYLLPFAAALALLALREAKGQKLKNAQ